MTHRSLITTYIYYQLAHRHYIVIVIVIIVIIVAIIVIVIVFLLVRSCPFIALITCLKGHKSLRVLFGSVFKTDFPKIFPRQLNRSLTDWLLVLHIVGKKHYHRALWETCDPWDMLSEWLGDMTWQTKRQWQRQRQRQWQWHLENTLKERPQRLFTFETFDQNDI